VPRASLLSCTLFPCTQQKDSKAREQNLGLALHEALELAVAGAVEHQSPTCFALCHTLRVILAGTSGGLDGRIQMM
jgi:hypothetical protein